MNTAIFQYKCQQCGKVENGTSTGADYAELKLTHLLAGMNRDLLLIVNYLHNCDESRTGIMSIIGYKLE